ncbi:MAG: AAA family ATPase [Nitrospirae bacterium]|nr:AAA family ATPase [Nitrospirota bacterium]
MKSIIDNILKAHYKKKYVYSEGKNEELEKNNFFSDLLGDGNLNTINERLRDASLMISNKEMLRKCYVNVETLSSACLMAVENDCRRINAEMSDDTHQLLYRPVTELLEKYIPWEISSPMRILVGCPGVGKSTFLCYFFSFHEEYFKDAGISTIIMDLHRIRKDDINSLYQRIYRALQGKGLTSSNIADPTKNQVITELINVVTTNKLIIVFDNIDKSDSFDDETALLHEILQLSSELAPNVKFIVSIRKITIHLHSHTEPFLRMKPNCDYIPAPPVNIVLQKRMSYIMTAITIKPQTLLYNDGPKTVSIATSDKHKRVFEYLPGALDEEVNDYLYFLSSGNLRIMLEKYFATVTSNHMNGTVLFRALVGAKFDSHGKRAFDFSDFFYVTCRDNREFFVEDNFCDFNLSKSKIVLLNIFDNTEKNCWYNNLIRYMILRYIYDNAATPVQLRTIFDKFRRLGFEPCSISICLTAFIHANLIRTNHFNTILIDSESTDKVVCTMAGRYYIDRLVKSIEYVEMMQFSTMSSHIVKGFPKKDALDRYRGKSLLPDFVNYLYNEELIAEAAISNLYDYETFRELIKDNVSGFSDMIRTSCETDIRRIIQKKKTAEKASREEIETKQMKILEQIIMRLKEKVVRPTTERLLERLKEHKSTQVPATPLIVARQIIDSYYAENRGMNDINVLKMEAILRLTSNGLVNHGYEVLFRGYYGVTGGEIFATLAGNKDTLKKLDFILLRTVNGLLSTIAAAPMRCVSVNLSDALIEDTALCHHVLGELVKTVTSRLCNFELVIELPETLEVRNIKKAKDIMNKFTMFKYALDDFFTRHSIHKQLYEDVPDRIHWLKVDHNVFQDHYESERDHLSASITALIEDIQSHNLSACVVVEGVEKGKKGDEHKDFLREIIRTTGFDRLYIQGFGVTKV